MNQADLTFELSRLMSMKKIDKAVQIIGSKNRNHRSLVAIFNFPAHGELQSDWDKLFPKARFV
jgi:hypothetical protein